MNSKRSTYRFIIWGVILLVLSTSCVEKYWPELTTDTDQFLVVDGNINNLSGPYTIKLSNSSPLLDTLFIPISSASVTILDDQGNKELLTEENPGIYKTSFDGIQGIVGRSYKVNIELANGEIYESAYEKLLSPVGIGEVYIEKEWQYAHNETEIDQEGFQFYVKSETSLQTDNYFFWEIEETFEYHSSYRIYFMYNGKKNNNALFEGLAIREMINIDTLYYCWKTQNLNEILSYGLESSDLSTVKNLPLHFVPLNDDRLRWGYNISIKQYTISKQAFTFLEYLKKQNNDQGVLFTTQPFQIRGNILNIQNPSEPVLGYFMVASGASTPRIQTRARGGLYYESPICYWDTVVSSNIFRLENSIEEDWPLFFSYFNFPGVSDPILSPVLILNYIAPPCIDCRSQGGVAIKPEFWEW